MCINVRNIGNRNLLPSRIKILLKDINSTVDANHPQTIAVVFRSFLFFPPDDDDADVSSGSPSFDASSNVVLPRFDDDDTPFVVVVLCVVCCPALLASVVVIVIASTNDWKLIIIFVRTQDFLSLSLLVLRYVLSTTQSPLYYAKLVLLLRVVVFVLFRRRLRPFVLRVCVRVSSFTLYTTKSKRHTHKKSTYLVVIVESFNVSSTKNK
jgi:hypothetical protein